jgi:class 3 adenylate cyclase/tetratricopeptide (TPR) repeat protein
MLLVIQLASLPVVSQNKGQERIDSLLKVVATSVNDTNKVMSLYKLAIESRRNDPQQALTLGEEALALAQVLNWKKGVADCLKNIGVTYHVLTDYPKERECYEKSLKIFEELDDRLGMGKCMNNIGITYYYLSDFPKALEYYFKALKIMEEFGNRQMIANSLNNIGAVYNSQSKYAKALEYYERSLKIKRELGDKTGIAICLTNIGNRYKNLADYHRALLHYQQSLKISEEIHDRLGIASGLESVGEGYYLMKDYPNALLYSNRALALSLQIGALDIQRDALKNISDVFEKKGNLKKSLDFFRRYIIVRDSIINGDKIMQMALTSMKIDYTRKHMADSLKQAKAGLLIEMEHKEQMLRQRTQKVMLYSVIAIVLVVVFGITRRLRYTRRAKAVIEKERDRSENLLLNILPVEIAEELKATGKSEARDFEMVSVLFSDFKEFTMVSEKLSAKELVSEINYCFEAFDGIVAKFGIEKIKTIGDSYMAAGGIPITDDGSVKNTVNAALEMQQFITRRKSEREAMNLIPFEMRLGIHTGPVVAGIVGIKKFQYDVWGDTVNTASRMESSGAVGKVNISQTTYDVIRDDGEFAFEYRGKITAKYKGEIDMYFVGRNHSRQVNTEPGSVLHAAH